MLLTENTPKNITSPKFDEKCKFATTTPRIRKSPKLVSFSLTNREVPPIEVQPPSPDSPSPQRRRFIMKLTKNVHEEYLNENLKTHSSVPPDILPKKNCVNQYKINFEGTPAAIKRLNISKDSKT